MRILVILICLFMVGFSLSCREAAQNVNERPTASFIKNLDGKQVLTDSLDEFIQLQMTRMKVPGVSMAIINDGKLVYYKVYGVADIASGKQLTDSTLFEGASTSKPVFAYMTMKLMEEGKIDLDTPLVKYLDPKYVSNYNFDERYAKITARMVLSHTTGFPNWRGNGDLTISFDPGSEFSYSGEGYQFLVRAVESILATNYKGLEEYFQEKVAQPLGMTHTKYVQDEYNRTHKATPHRNGETMEINLWTTEEFNAASALHTNALEFSSWVIALLDKEGLEDKTFELLFEDQITVEEAPSLQTEEGAIAWTPGFAKYDQKGHIVYGHEGNNDGFNALFLLDREKRWAMIQFNNANEVYDFGYDLFGYLHKE